MFYFGMPQQGMSPIGGNVIHVEDALINEVYTENRRTGYVLITYGVPAQNPSRYDQVQLNVDRNTRINNEFREPITLSELENGMRISVDFSAAMTRSIPPQSNAFRIEVLPEQLPPVMITTDRVVSVDAVNGMLTTGNPYDINDQMVFNISSTTVILDRDGNRIPLSAIQPGQMVRVEHANFQTLSIPPQSPAYRVQVQ